MPKIVLGVSSSFCANFLKGQVAFLVKNGFEVIIISGPGEEISMLAKTENARLFTVNFTKKISPLTDLFQLIRIARFIKSEKPAIVNAGNPKSGFLIMLACWLVKSRNRVFTLHGLLSDTKHGWLRWLITSTEKISCNIAEKVIVVSPSLKAHAEKREILLKGKGIVIEKGSCNGIDLHIFSKDENTVAQSLKLKDKIGLVAGDISIGFVGRLSKDKGIEILFKAFNILVKEYSRVRLVVAGPLIEENPFSPDFMEQLYNDERIVYLGKMLEIQPVYGIIDILVLPSFREGFPNVLIESSAMGVPVVASDIPGCQDALQQNITGELFEKGNVQMLVAILKKLIGNKKLREQYGRNGQLFVRENFSDVKIWNGQLKLYSGMLGN